MEVVSLLSDSDEESDGESSKKETRCDGGAKRPASANDDALIVLDSDGDENEPHAEEMGRINAKKQRRKSKSDQSTSTTLSSSVSSYSSSTAWVCNACTFKNQKPLALACEMCAVPRATADEWAQKESHSISNNWTCSRCTLLNPTDQNACSVCEHPDDEGGGNGEGKSKISKPSFTSAAIGGQVQRKRPMDNERRLQMARWKEDRENSISSKKRPRHQSSFRYEQTAGRTESNIDFRALAAARSQRQQQGLSSDSATRGDGIHMPGEVGISTLRYWDLTAPTQLVGTQHASAKCGLCTAGQRHLATIKNALNHRMPSVILKRAQYLSNPPLVRKFEALKARLTRSHEVVYLFHGTGSQNINSIAQKGFLVRHAASGPGLVWFSRQSTYSHAFTSSVPGKGLASNGGGNRMSAALNPSALESMMRPSGRMFVCALLVARGPSETSNVGDKGQDVITMTREEACLPCYLIDTELAAGTMNPGGMALAGFGMNAAAAAGGPQPFTGRGKKLGGRKV